MIHNDILFLVVNFPSQLSQVLLLDLFFLPFFCFVARLDYFRLDNFIVPIQCTEYSGCLLRGKRAATIGRYAAFKTSFKQLLNIITLSALSIVISFTLQQKTKKTKNTFKKKINKTKQEDRVGVWVGAKKRYKRNHFF